MNTLTKVSAGMLAGLLSTLLPTLSYAETGDLSLKIDVGAATPVVRPQADRIGVDGNAKLLIGVGNYVAVGPTFSTLSLFRPDRDAQTTWGEGAGVLFRRPLSNQDASSLWISPWVDTDFQFVKYDNNQTRPAWSVAIGAALPFDDQRSVWVGTFVRFQDILAVNGDRYDAKIGVLGLSFEFGASHAPVHHSVLPPVVTPPVPVPVTVSVPVVATPAPVVEAPFEIKQKIQFAFDSAALQGNSTAALDDIAQAVKNHNKYNVTVEGFASSEGDAKYNQALSLRRAQTVVDYLSQTVDKSHLTAVGMGTTNPVADNSDEAHRAPNRRVEFVTVVVTVTQVDDRATVPAK